MKNIIKTISLAITIGTFMASDSIAGNNERAGQAGASELLINPWARTSGFAGANSASVKGLESIYLNSAGLAFTKKTELVFARSTYITGSGIHLNAFGFSQHVGTSGVMALSVNQMSFGDIQITTADLPEGGIGTFSPNFTNINLSYAKEFSNSIYGGVNLKVISESMSNASAKGVGIDAGIQYVTGNNEEKNNVHFGIALKNVGPSLKYTGDGFSFRGYSPTGGYVPPKSIVGTTMTLEQRSAEFELPSLLNIAGAYDFRFAQIHRLTVAATFTSNSFSKDQINSGLEYGFKSYLMLRAGYSYNRTVKTDLYGKESSFFTGPTAGLTFEVPMSKKSGTTFGLDYSYRATILKGVHSIGVRINI